MDAILYACPVGDFQQRIETYYNRCARTIGSNTAHRYMPHATLTGFFPIQAGIIPALRQYLVATLASDITPGDARTVDFQQPVFKSDFHFLPIIAPWWEQVAYAFKQQCLQRWPQLHIRLKQQLHLSFAYEFVPEHAIALRQLAEDAGLTTVPTSVAWEWRLYTRTVTEQDHWQWELLWSAPQVHPTN